MKILYVTVFLSTFLFPIVSLQFTIISGIAGIAGVYGLITSNNKKEKVVAFLLLIVSSLIRMDSFRLAIVVFIPAYIYKLYFYYFYKNHALFSLSHLKHNLWVLYLAISIAAAEILHHYSANAYGYYYQFNITRVEILDKEGLEKISHDDKTGILQNVGWSLNDYDMLMNWFFLDSTIYNKSNFLKIINLIPKKKINSLFNFIASNYKHLISEILSLPVMWALLLIYLSVILYEASYIKFFFLVITLLYFFLLYLLISFFYRVPPERVFIVMDAATAIIPFAINIIHSANSLFERVNNFYIRVLLVVISFYPVQKILRDTRYTIVYTWGNFKKSDKQPLKEIVEELAAQYPNMKLLVSWAAAFPYEMIEPFKDTSYLNTIKIFSLGTYQQLPENQELLSKLNITDLYLAICEQPDIYVLILKRFADKYPILYQTYMKEHYKKNIIYQFLPDPFPNAVLVKFSIAEEK
ncbi:MAG: hypothetical protein NZ519_13620 [Bacteroidia bacterium]|nr:hypothetical protein [Bacteroidia bacterium]